MHSTISNHIKDLKVLCQQNKVKQLYLFGSALLGNGIDINDVDFAVVFSDLLSPLERAEAFFSLKEELEILLSKDVDLISYDFVRNQVFKQELDSTKFLVYAA